MGATMTIQNRECAKCGEVGMKFKGKDSYCLSCRKAVNAARSSPEAKKKRSDRYYWNTHVPRLQARLNAKYPIAKQRVGVFYATDKTGDLTEGFRYMGEDENSTGTIYRRETWEGYKLKLYGDGE
jgi:uncharacterized Zn finger protein (UPF0148 family)